MTEVENENSNAGAVVYSAAFRSEAVEMYLSGLTAEDVSRRLGCSDSTVLGWVRKKGHTPRPTGSQAGPRITVQRVQRDAHAMAVSKGWWGRPEDLTPDSIAAKLALIHSEVSEALECVRDDDMQARETDDGKPEGMPSELADIVLRTADLAGALGIDLASAIEAKMAFNSTRKHRHGGRRL